MRSSDWSSDVCSSDLILEAHPDDLVAGGRPAVPGAVKGDEGVVAVVLREPVARVEDEGDRRGMRGVGECGAFRLPAAELLQVALLPREHRVGLPVGEAEIGRASCRERVCQYM